MNMNVSAYSNLSDTELLGKLIGVRQARKLYRGSLAALFAASHEPDPQHAKCVIARELVKRWLNEELKREVCYLHRVQ
jgi:DNA repair protein RadC